MSINLVKDSTFWKELSERKAPFLLMFGEEHGFVCNSQIEVRWTDAMLNSGCINTILLEYDPSYVLWLKMALHAGDSVKLLQMSQDDPALSIYWKFLIRRFSGRPIEKIPIFGVDAIEDIDVFISRFIKYLALQKGTNRDIDSLRQMFEHCALKKRKKKAVEKIISFYLNHPGIERGMEIDFRYMMNCLSGYFNTGFKKVKIQNRDTFMYLNYSNLRNSIDNFKGIIFVGKFHMAKSNFKIGKEIVKPFARMIETNRDKKTHMTEELITVLLSYQFKTLSNTNTFIVNERQRDLMNFQLSYKIPCKYINDDEQQFPNLSMNAISDMVQVNNACTNYLLFVNAETKLSVINFH